MKTEMILRRVVLCFMLGLLAQVAWAADLTTSYFEFGDFSYMVNDDGKGVTATKYKGSEENVIIPAEVTYDGKIYPVTVLGYSCFQGDTTLVSVRIPTSVTRLEGKKDGNGTKYGCFYGCSRLASVSIPSSVASLGESCFYGCSSLASVSIPSSVTSLGKSCFYGCSSLASVSIPSSVASLGESCFNGCSSLASVSIPSSVTSLGNSCFNGCSSLASVSIPSSVTSLGNSCFNGCSCLASVSIPSSVTSLGNSCFQGCSSLASVNIPASVTFIGARCFYNTSLTSCEIESDRCSFELDERYDIFPSTCIHIEDGIGYVGKYAVGDIEGVHDELKFKEGTVGVAVRFRRTSGNKFFAGKLILPKSLRYAKFVNYGARVDRLDSCPFDTIEVFSENLDSLIFGSTSSSDFVSGICKKVVLHEEVKKIPSARSSYLRYKFLFYNWFDNFRSIALPSTIEVIGDYAFYNCVGLISIDIPNSVTSIGNYAFYGCDGLTSIDIPNSVTSIGNYAFRGCDALTSIDIPNSVTSIGDQALLCCFGLRSITLPASLEKIGKSVLGSFYINKDGTISRSTPDSLEYISIQNLSSWCNAGEGTPSPLYFGTKLYLDGKEITDLKIPGDVDSICPMAFYGQKSITSLTLPSSVRKVGEKAFYDTQVRSVISRQTNPQDYADAFSEVAYLHCPLYVPEGSYWDYVYNSGWGKFAHIKEYAVKAQDISSNKVYMIADARGFNYSVYDKDKGALKSVEYAHVWTRRARTTAGRW